mmetsp:Transcript_1904/g.5772  ORF Transcript_1904/g.5772 Transcript_1904/m.5772 type:complete len:427 (+) Transcript_1904:173-1453(+)
MSATKTGIITPARKTLRFRTPLREKTSNTNTTTTEEEDDDETEALLRHELAHARAEIALLREEKAMRRKTSGTSKSSSKPSFGKKKNNDDEENETTLLKSPVLLPSPPTLETPMRFRRERDSFRKELKMLSQNAEENETKMLEENEKTMRLSRENEAWLLKALNEKTRALKIAAKANNASEKELAQTKENASVLEKDVAEHAEKVRVLKLRLVKNERARKKLETKVERYREALKDANLRRNNNGGNEEAAMMSQESVDTAMSNESYCGENKVALRDDDDENNIIHNNNTNNNTRVKVEEEKEDEEEEDEVHFRVFPEQMVDTNDPLLGGVPATPAMFQFASKMHKNVVGTNEYETRATDMTTTPGGGEVVEFYGRPRRDTRKDVFVILSVWMMTIAALVSMGKSSSLSSQVVAGHRVVVKGFGFFC